MNQVTNKSAVPDWLATLFASVDAMDSGRFVRFLSEDATFCFGSAPPVQGRSAIAAAVDGFFETIAGCRHTVNRHWSDSATIACEGEVNYRRHDGSEISLPFVDVFELQGESISSYKIYIDIGPLYAS